MNFLPKQIIASFFSLSIFLISAEAWSGHTQVPVSTTGTCEAACDIVTASCGQAGDTLTLSYTGRPNYVITCVGATNPALPDIKTICKEQMCEVYLPSTSKNTFAKTMCNAFKIATGSAGKTFAAFAIIATGIGFFSGKVSWGLMIGVAAGIATMFGAPSIVAAISGQNFDSKCALNSN